MNYLILLLVIPFIVCADIFTQNQRLFQSLNMGDYLEAPTEGSWGSGLLQETDFQRVAEKGFTAVRIPVRWSGHLTDDGSIDSVFMKRVHWAVKMANKYGMCAVVDDHHFDSLMANPDLYEPVMESIWEQVAQSFQLVSDDSLFFEPVNEPHTNLTPERWNLLHPRFISIIRKSNPTRPIIVGTTGWGGIIGLRNLTLPNDPNLIATVHYYLPFQFTHQGADWVGDDATAWLGTEWKGNFLEKEMIRADIDEIAEWSKINKVPVFLGEFGAYSKADMSSRLRWTHFCARLFESRKIPWAYWEYSHGFGLYDLVNQLWRDALVDTLLSKDSSTLLVDSSTVKWGNEQISNGRFSGSMTDWHHNVWGGKAVASVKVTDSGAVHTVTQLGDEIYNIQLLQSGITLKKGTQYLFSVDASTSDSIQISTVLMRPDFTTVGATDAILIRPTGTTVYLVVTPNADETSITAGINLGHTAGSVNIHSVSLREYATATSVMGKSSVSKKVPIRSVGRVIHLSEPVRAGAQMKLYTVSGREVFTQELTSGQQVVNVPAELSCGWYGLEIEINGTVVQQSELILN